MQETERDLLVRIDTKLDVYKNHFDAHVIEDNRRFDEIFRRLRILDKVIGGLIVIEIAVAMWLKFWH